MVRASDVLLGYFVIGAVMWGGGAISFDDAGVVGAVVDDDGGLSVDDGLGNELSEQSGIIRSLASLAVGSLVFVINLISIFFTYLNWPIWVLVTNNAPPVITVLLGGSFTAAFYLSMLSIVR